MLLQLQYCHARTPLLNPRSRLPIFTKTLSPGTRNTYETGTSSQLADSHVKKHHHYPTQRCGFCDHKMPAKAWSEPGYRSPLSCENAFLWEVSIHVSDCRKRKGKKNPRIHSEIHHLEMENTRTRLRRTKRWRKCERQTKTRNANATHTKQRTEQHTTTQRKRAALTWGYVN